MTKRRDLLILAGLLASPLLAFRAYEEWGRGSNADAGFAFSPLSHLPGFRRLDEGGPVSAATGDPFIGLVAPGEPARPRPLGPGALCAALFGPGDPGGRVRVASFSDYYCPFCRDLTLRLAERERDGIEVTWHELPILGSGSEAAARAALAADAQGLYAAFQARLLRAAFRPTEAYLRQLSDSIGADADRLMADMESPAIAARLHDSARAAATLGIAATPALVVGRTLVGGVIPDARLDALIALERAEGPVC